MKKLKTLKEMDVGNPHCGEHCGNMFCQPSAIKHELRVEAIKWVKHLTISNPITGRLDNSLADVMWMQSERETRAEFAQAEWIKRFFNITDEDLK